MAYLLYVRAYATNEDDLGVTRVTVKTTGDAYSHNFSRSAPVPRKGELGWCFVVGIPFDIEVELEKIEQITDTLWVRTRFRAGAHVTATTETIEFRELDLIAYGHSPTAEHFEDYPPQSPQFQMEITLPRSRPLALDVGVEMRKLGDSWKVAPTFTRIQDHHSHTSEFAVSVGGHSRREATFNTLSLRRTRYLCQPGDHSGDTWAMAAAMLLAPNVSLILTTRPSEEVDHITEPWIEFVDFSAPPSGIELSQLQLTFERGQTYTLPGAQMNNGRMSCPLPDRCRVKAVAVSYVHEHPPEHKDFLPHSDTIVHRYRWMGVCMFDFHHGSAEGGMTMKITVAEHHTRRFSSSPEAFEPAEPRPVSTELTLYYRSSRTVREHHADETTAKFHTKFNQATKFYSDVGIESSRVVVDNGVKVGRSWKESFNLGCENLRKRGLAEKRRYGMTWASTSILMKEAERCGVPYVQSQLRSAFVRGLSKRVADRTRRKLDFMRANRRYLFINMRYATHNREHNVTRGIYRQLRAAAGLFGLTVVRVGLPHAPSQRTGRDWMAELTEPAIDIYNVNGATAGPIEVDMRETACLWKHVAEAGNAWIIGGRSGSFDVACLLGVRGFSWDIIDREPGVEQTEYARLWMTYPFMSVGARSPDLENEDAEDAIDTSALYAWLAGHDVIPKAAPPDEPFAQVGFAAKKTKHALLFDKLAYLG